MEDAPDAGQGGSQAAHAGARDAVVVLPGTRWPEAGANMRTLLEAAAHAQDDEGGPIEGSEGGCEKKRGAPVLLLAPVPGGFPGDEVGAIIEAEGWELSELQEATRGLPTGSVSYTRRARAAPGRGGGASRGKIPNAQNDAWSLLLLPAPAFAPALFASTLGLCMAGTATEQLVGLGRRAFTVACGAGPQFTPAFAEAQVRLLGADSVGLAVVDRDWHAASSALAPLAGGFAFADGLGGGAVQAPSTSVTRAESTSCV